MPEPPRGKTLPPERSIEIAMLSTPETESYAWLGIRSWQAYCDRHGYGFHITRERLVPDMHPVWSKIEMMRRQLRETDSDYVILVDADSVVYDFDTPLCDVVDFSKPLTFASDRSILGVAWLFKRLALKIKTRRFVLPNAGFVAVENSAYTQAFFDEWMSLACGKYENLADIHPRNQNVLWHGMLHHHSPNIATLGNSVVRVTHPQHLKYLRLYNPLVVHFKHEAVSAEDVGNFLKSRIVGGSGA